MQAQLLKRTNFFPEVQGTPEHDFLSIGLTVLTDPFSVPGQLTASKVALFWPAALRCASRAVHLCGSNGTANG